MRRLLAVLALGGIVVACSEQATAPQPRTPAIAADFMNNEDGGGPWIGRYEFNDWASYWGSADGSVRAIHTTFPLSATDPFSVWGWDDAVCGPPAPGVMHIQEITHWDPGQSVGPRFMENGKADVWIVLVSRAPGAYGPCAGRPVLASGWGQLHYNDNDFFMTTGKDMWSIRAEGRLTTPDGGAVSYTGRTGCVVNPVNWKCTNSVEIH